MIGDISYIANHDTGPSNFIGSFWEWFGGLFRSRHNASSISSSDPAKHTTGTSSPKYESNPGGSYVQMGSNNQIYSYAQYDSGGRQTMRIDFQGKPHKGVLPHIHIYTYFEQGNRREWIYDMMWHQIK